jgi:calcium-dependent protein kinase
LEPQRDDFEEHNDDDDDDEARPLLQSLAAASVAVAAASRPLWRLKAIMGSCLSSVAAGGTSSVRGAGKGWILDHTDGGDVDYHERFLEDHVIGEGEFGQVKLVIDIREEKRLQQQSQSQQNSSAAPSSSPAQATTPPLACKILRKGMTFKDNTIYSPIKPEILRGEVEILRALAGQSYCLNLVAVYESKRSIYIVTDFCAGGDAFQYVAAQNEDLHTEDVSRIAYQLFSAVNHCALHAVMHRDIKPENSCVPSIFLSPFLPFTRCPASLNHHCPYCARAVMFADPAPRSPMRLIDFGSGCMDAPKKGAAAAAAASRSAEVDTTGDDMPMHTTFAGSAFYISPELFQRSYNLKTDVWSAGTRWLDQRFCAF